MMGQPGLVLEVGAAGEGNVAAGRSLARGCQRIMLVALAMKANSPVPCMHASPL